MSVKTMLTSAAGLPEDESAVRKVEQVERSDHRYVPRRVINYTWKISSELSLRMEAKRWICNCKTSYKRGCFDGDFRPGVLPSRKFN